MAWESREKIETILIAALGAGVFSVGLAMPLGKVRRRAALRRDGLVVRGRIESFERRRGVRGGNDRTVLSSHIVQQSRVRLLEAPYRGREASLVSRHALDGGLDEGAEVDLLMPPANDADRSGLLHARALLNDEPPQYWRYAIATWVVLVPFAAIFLLVLSLV